MESEDTELESAIAGLYRGPLEEFVRHRGLLAKELRAAGRRADASAIKALRKPSRMAWVLDVAALEARHAFDALEAAVAATVEAHAGGGTVRVAIAELRAAVREFAKHAAGVSERAGYRVEETDLANAVLAVLGNAEAHNALRSSRLAEIPEAGGLDFFASLPAPETRPTPAARERPQPAAPSRSSQRDVLERAAREADVALGAARARVSDAESAVQDVESKLELAEKRLREAEAEARALRSERDLAHKQLEDATEKLTEAQTAAADAERRVDELNRPARTT